MLDRFLMLAAVGAVALTWTLGDTQAAAVGQSCGGALGVTCGPGLWCDPTPGSCAPDGQGKCVKVPQVCNDLYMPVCGCNGKTFSNDCWRAMGKEPKRQDGPC